MSPDKILEVMAEVNPEAIVYDNLKSALVGIATQFNKSILVYDYQKCIDIIMDDGMTREEAEEYFNFNVLGCWAGEHTPCFINMYHCLEWSDDELPRGPEITD